MATLTTERPATIERPLEVESIPETYRPIEEQDNESPGFWGRVAGALRSYPDRYAQYKFTTGHWNQFRI